MFHVHITCRFLALWTNATLRLQVSDLRLTLHRLLGIFSKLTLIYFCHKKAWSFGYILAPISALYREN